MLMTKYMDQEEREELDATLDTLIAGHEYVDHSREERLALARANEQ